MIWWYNTKLSQALIGNQFLGSSTKTTLGNATTAQYSCAFLCDEIVDLWRIAALAPSLSPEERAQLKVQLKDYHLKAVEKVYRILNNNAASASNGADGNHNQNNGHQNGAAAANGVANIANNNVNVPLNGMLSKDSCPGRLSLNDPRRYDFDAFPGFKVCNFFLFGEFSIKLIVVSQEISLFVLF